MKIAVVHSFYRSAVPSGENQTVRAQVEALREAGHDVALIAQHTDSRARRHSYPLQAAVSVATGIGPSPVTALQSFGPDVVHVHNLFPNFGSGWLHTWRGPIVATLHNFRPMCAAGTLFRDGDVCTRCPDGDTWASLRYGCYRDSRIATAPLAWRNRHGAPGDPVIRRADALIVLSGRARRVYEDAGVDAGRLHLVPNFVPDRGAAPATIDQANGRWLFAGRLTPEKGIQQLLRRWPEGECLDVMGDGPLLESARADAPDGVRFLGPMSNEAVREALPRYVGLIIASRWFEGLPTVYVEALAAGIPVVAVEGNAAADDVAARSLGAVLPRNASESDTAALLAAVRRGGQTLRRGCRRAYQSRFLPQRWIQAVGDVYAELLGVATCG